MADETKGDELTPQDTPPAEESDTTQSESPDQTQGEEKDQQSDATGENQTDEESSEKESGDQSERQEAKPTRFDKRLKDLIGKVREAGGAHQQTTTNEQPLQYTPDEIKKGEVDPEAFINRVRSEVRTEMQLENARKEYNNTLQAHQADLESVKDLDPDLEAEAVKEYEMVNKQINPYTGEEVFYPTVKFSEVVTKLQTRSEKLARKMAEKIAEGEKEYLKNVSSNQAVPSGGQVSGSKTIKPETTNFSEFEKAYSS